MKKEKIEYYIEKFKKEHIQFTSDELLKYGKITPQITILAYNPKENSVGLVVAPIIGGMDEVDKEEISNKFIPGIFDTIKKKNLIPYCFSFSSEIYLKSVKVNKDSDLKNIKSNLKNIQSQEGLIISFESKNSNSNFIYTMERVGKSINSDGNIIDSIKLTPIEENGKVSSAEGRFSNIFKKYAND